MIEEKNQLEQWQKSTSIAFTGVPATSIENETTPPKRIHSNQSIKEDIRIILRMQEAILAQDENQFEKKIEAVALLKIWDFCSREKKSNV